MVAALLTVTIPATAVAARRTTVVPNVVGLSSTQAWATLIRHDLCVASITTTITGHTHNPRTVDHITRQTPKAGTRVAVASLVSLLAKAPALIGPWTKITTNFATVTNPRIKCSMPRVSLIR